MKLGVIISLMLLLLSISPAWAQQSDLPELPGMPDLFAVTLRVIISLIFVIALLAGGFYLLRRLSGRGSFQSEEVPVKLLWQQSIGPRRSICLVKVLDKVLVLGVTNASISHLMTLSPQESSSLDAYRSMGGPMDLISTLRRLGNLRRRR